MSKHITWHVNAWEDYLYWQKNDKAMLKKINVLVKESLRDPCKGSGKPEPLKHALAGCWSRRINQEHRLIYKPTSDGIYILQCRYHYG